MSNSDLSLFTGQVCQILICHILSGLQCCGSSVFHRYSNEEPQHTLGKKISALLQKFMSYLANPNLSLLTLA